MKKMLAQRYTDTDNPPSLRWEFEIEDDWSHPDLIEKIYDSAVEAGLATDETWPKGNAWLVDVSDISAGVVVFVDRVFLY